MHKWPSDFYTAIPPTIRPLILDCRILPSEDAKAYCDLLIEFWKLCRPNTVMQWLDLKKLVDLVWEGLRLSRLKPEIINSGRKRALSSLLLSMTNESVRDFTPSGNMTQAEEQAIGWYTVPGSKKKIKALLDKFDFSEITIDAVAFTQHADDLETLEKLQNWNEARLLAVRRQIEEEREVLGLQADAVAEAGQTARRRLPVVEVQKLDQAEDVNNMAMGSAQTKAAEAEEDDGKEEEQAEAEKAEEDDGEEDDDEAAMEKHGDDDNQEEDDQEEAA